MNNRFLENLISSLNSSFFQNIPSLEVLNKNELQEEVLDERGNPKIPVFYEGQSTAKFRGFQYFSPYTLKSGHLDARFILARNKKCSIENAIQGVMKLDKIKALDWHPSYWELSYVDIRKDKQRRGIATMLYSKLNGILTPEDYLVGTFESPLGKKAKLHELRKRVVVVCPNFKTQKEFYKHFPKSNHLK